MEEGEAGLNHMPYHMLSAVLIADGQVRSNPRTVSIEALRGLQIRRKIAVLIGKVLHQL